MNGPMTPSDNRMVTCLGDPLLPLGNVSPVTITVTINEIQIKTTTQRVMGVLNGWTTIIFSTRNHHSWSANQY